MQAVASCLIITRTWEFGHTLVAAWRYVRQVIRVNGFKASWPRWVESTHSTQEEQESVEAGQAMGRNGGKLSVVCLQAACGQPYAVGLVATLALNLP